MNKASNSLQQDPSKLPNSGPTIDTGITLKPTGATVKPPEKRPAPVVEDEHHQGPASNSQIVKKVKVESNISHNNQIQQSFMALEEDDHIEQMIQELIHYGSIELCSTSAF